MYLCNIFLFIYIYLPFPHTFYLTIQFQFVTFRSSSPSILSRPPLLVSTLECPSAIVHAKKLRNQVDE